MDPTITELEIQATSPEEALVQASRQLGLPDRDLKVLPQGENIFLVQIAKRDGLFELFIEPDQTRVILKYLFPPIGTGKAVTLEDVLSRLHSMGVTHGIDKKALGKAVSESRRTQRPCRDIVGANYTPPVDGRDASIEYLPEDIAKGLNADSPVKHLVRKGEVIARKTPLVMPQVGRTVMGVEIPGKGGRDMTPKNGEGVEFTIDNAFIARRSGFLQLVAPASVRESGSLKIIPPVQISPDGLQATITLYPLLLPDRVYTPQLLLELLEEYGVRQGIRQADLTKICRYISERKTPVINLLIAQGQAPVRGEDGKVNFAVETQPQAGTILSDGRIDFHQRGFLRGLKKGEVIAHKIPPTVGKPGVNVLGKELPAARGKEAALSARTNIEISADGEWYRASRDGAVLVLPGGEIAIVDRFEHQGDVDYSVGNLKMEGSLVISGSVKAGFSVEAKGDILIGGSIEAARVTAGASLGVLRGIIGKEKGIVRAGTRLTALYVDAATLICDGDIEIADALMHSEVFCRNQLLVIQKTGRIAGGTCVVGKKICAREIGTAAGANTRLIIGLTRDQHLALLDIQGKIQSIQMEIDRPGTSEIIKNRYLGLIEELKAQQSRMTQSFPADFPGCQVEVQGRIYPGVEIVFGIQSLQVTEILSHVVFKYDMNSQSVYQEPLGK